MDSFEVKTFLDEVSTQVVYFYPFLSLFLYFTFLFCGESKLSERRSRIFQKIRREAFDEFYFSDSVSSAVGLKGEQVCFFYWPWYKQRFELHRFKISDLRKVELEDFCLSEDAQGWSLGFRVDPFNGSRTLSVSKCRNLRIKLYFRGSKKLFYLDFLGESSSDKWGYPLKRKSSRYKLKFEAASYWLARLSELQIRQDD